MVLFWQLFFCEFVKDCHLFGEHFGLSESFRHKHVLANKEQVWLNHSNWAEKRFQVVGKLWTTSVTRVHRDENTDAVDKVHLVVKENNLMLVGDQTILDSLNLSRNDGQDFYVDTVELVEATPETSLDQTREDDTHSSVIQRLTAIGNDAT